TISRGDTDCYRVLNGDGDGLSGVVIDRYADVLVIQLLTAGAETMRAELIERLTAVFAPRAILERSQGAVRRQEGLEDHAGLIAGANAGEVVVRENGVRIAVALQHGRTTGAFLVTSA